MAHLTFLLLAPIALATVAGVGVLGWLRLRGPMRQAFLAFSVAEGGWIITATARLASAPELVMVRLTEVAYICAAATVVGWLWFALIYARRWRGLPKRLFKLYAAEAVVFAGFVVTNRFHGLVWTDVVYRVDGLFPTIRYAIGPVGLFHFLLSWLALIASLVLVLRVYTTASRPFQRVSRWLIAGLLLPVLLNIVFVAWTPDTGADFTSLALAFTSAAVAMGLGRDALLDVRPLARAALVEQLREGVVVLDTQSRVADVNPAARMLLGSHRPVLGLHIGDVLDEEQRAAAAALWGAQQAQAEVPFTIGGDRRYYDVLISPLEDEGRPAGRLVLIYDLTDLRRQQNALHQTNTLLQSQNAALDDFAHTVAHDLKTSIQHLVGHAELLHEDGPRLSDEEHRDLASGLVRSGLKLDSIVQELLLFARSRRDAVSPVPLDMAAIFTEAMDRLHPTLEAAGAHVAVTTDWPDVLGYAAWIETVWYNYISNAAKYGGRPAHITVCSDAVDADGYVRYWVQDTGPGMSERDQTALFEPFSRLPGADGEGHGLGLSIVRRIMERLGGTCGVESAGVEGEGSRFWFTLPAVPSAPR